MLTLVTTWEAVAAAVQRRMDDLSLTQKALAMRAGVAENTIRKLLSGEEGNYRRVTLASVSNALDWPGDTLQRISEGEDPLAGDPISASGLVDPADTEVIDRLERIEETLQKLLRQGGASGRRGDN